MYFLFLGQMCPSMTSWTVWPGGLLNFRKSTIHSFVSFRKLCTYDLEPCSSSPLLRKENDIIRLGPKTIDNISRDIVILI